MAKPMPSPVDPHLLPVRRRLTLAAFLRLLVWTWTAALLLTAGWVVAQPWLLRGADADPRWLVVVGGLVLATAAAALVAWLRAPRSSRQPWPWTSASASVERTTTLLGLTPEQQDSAAGQALRADVEERVRGLDVGRRFGVGLPWRLWLPPAGAAVLVVLAWLFAPVPPPLGAADTNDVARVKVKPELIEKAKDELKDALKAEKAKDQPRSDKLREILLDIEQIANNDFDPNNKDDVLDQARALNDEEKKIDEEIQKAEEREEHLKKEFEKVFGKEDEDNPRKEGPGKQAEDALGKGDLNKAADELNKLAGDLKNDKLNDEQKQQLQDQIQQMKERIDKAAEEQKQKQKELEEKQKKAEEQKQQADKEKAQAKNEQEKQQAEEKQKEAEQKQAELKKQEGELKEQEKQQQDLNKLGQKLGQAEKDLKEGDGKDAAQKLGDAAKDLKDLGAGQEKQDLENLKLQLQNAREKMLAGLEGGGPRPFAQDGDTKSKNEKQHAFVDSKGKQQRVGFTQGGSNQSKFSAKEVQGVFRQAQQCAAEETERQGGTLETRAIESHYFGKLANGKKK